MARVRTVDFLPEIFQTSTNRQFLGATLDQLVQEPKFKKIQGFVGRRVGPGVNANDKYVAETDSARANYQLEPGVVLKSSNNGINDAITYPGIIDALSLQGANTTKSDRLFSSDFYSWDPFVDFDKFVNFNQYYWLPAGPDAVDVYAETTPSTDQYTVTRADGVYTFSGTQGNNPTLTLVRGGNYTFDVAQNDKETVNYRVTNSSTSAYVIDYQNNPTLTLVRGNTYVFNLILTGNFPFYIKTANTLGTTNIYSQGVTNNGGSEGLITFVVPQDAPDTLYYTNSEQPNMNGQLNIVDGTAGTGPGFWIQTAPGVDGKVPSTPNLSSRDVLGVFNNGEDLGTVTFDVPSVDAQDFYYNLPWVGNQTTAYLVDLVTNLQFNQVNNQPVASFLEANGGIDGIANLNGRTVVFTNPNGWEITDVEENFGGGFDAAVPVPEQDRYNVWFIQYVDIGGVEYIQCSIIKNIDDLQKFNISYGTVYSSTQWYKNSVGTLTQVPSLTAAASELYYQDGTDPAIFGRIKLISQDEVNTIDIDDIVDKKNYTSPNGVEFTNGLKVTFIGQVIPTSYQNNSYYVEGVGTAIKLLPVADFVTPETYTKSATVPYDSTPYDVGNYDASLNQPELPDYLTINRASLDLNPWTRSNRWFHIDVINASAAYNGVVPVLDNAFRAKRPVLEFRAGTKLFDFGTEGKQPIDIIDFAETDALSNINGQISYGVDEYEFINGTRVIFAADVDPQVRNKIYTVEFITPDTQDPLISQPIINLIPATDSAVTLNQTVVCLSGNTLQGKSFYFDGVEWLNSQQKNSINQPPLFDVYDSDGVSLSNTEKYPGSNFVGSKLFSYAQGAGNNDAVLGFPLKYLSIKNVGDIVFDNNLYKDTFTYTKDNNGLTSDISIGFVRQYSTRTVFVKEIGWQNAVEPVAPRQQFRFSYDGNPLLLDVKVTDNTTIPPIQLYVGADYQEPGSYTYTTTDNTTTITLLNTFFNGDVVEVDVLSDQASKVAFYTVPGNLSNNPLNVNSDTFTLGTVRTHYETICENLLTIQGPINGANNSRDLGNLIPYGTNIVQQSSPLTMAGYFMRSAEYNIFNALAYNSREYEKFKAQLLDTAVRNDYTNFSIPNMLTAVVSDINTGKTSINPFYWSDMLPASSVYTQSSTTVTAITPVVFDLSTTYDFTSSNFKGLLIYLNNELLLSGYDYIVSTDAPTVTITRSLSVGDIVTIQEYAATYGNFVPNTPTKMGLYPAFKPEIYLDTTYINPTFVIQGHDGSKTVAFGDFRDELLLEFETRIYNNLKIKSAVPVTAADVIPGQFRTTDYSLTEINTILAPEFLSWVGWNKLDYKNQVFNANNEFTWNYVASGNRLSSSSEDGEVNLPVGAWRGIYRYFYDTDYPATRPWEMLGFTEKPAWWEDIYGPAPYTSGNLVLWENLQEGYVADPAGEYYLPQYARPRLTEVIPVDSEGNLLSPFDSVVGLYDSSQFQKSWAFGDGGPVEATWFKSSSYPFAIMRLLALTRPAEFFALFADRDLYKFDTDLDQYIYNERYRLDANGIQVYGEQEDGVGLSKASYINWIVDYNQQTGRNSTVSLETDLQNLDVRLCYRMGAFTDKQYLKIYAEKSSPDSINSSLLLPDESYQLLLYKNQPFESITYSSIIIQVVEDGYTVYGYGILQPYFNILTSRTYGTKTVISAGGTTVTVPDTYSDNVVQVPYGYVFTNQTVVVDFLLSYGALLETQGLTFETRENGKTLNWNQMAQEFLYWANQGWGPGSVINLNPTATTLTATRTQAIVDSINVQTQENLLLDQNRTTIPVRDLVVDRFENTFSVTSLTQQTLNFADLKYTSYENMVVLDNVSIFNDLLYDPATGARQSRLNIVAAVSADWNGQLDAQGFILNNSATIKEWESNRKYAKGEIVSYKNNYWSAQTIVQPSAEFRYSDWVKSDYTKIQRGLLQNIPNLADQLANSYDVNSANLETDQDLVSYGLIGFRPREYMTSLNLDDVSQVNVYKQFLKDKGSIRSVRLLGNAQLGKEVAEYDVFENWAVLRSTYGANANRSFVEFRLNSADLDSDPSVIQVIEPGETSSADQQILLQNIWRQSYKLTSADIFPTTIDNPTDSALPSAGYVNLDDVDITVFSLLGNLAIAPAVLDTIGIGTTIWAAKSNSYDWNIYRCSGVSGRIINVTSNLNGTATVTFSQAHGLALNNIVVIRLVDSRIDGVYRVLSVPSPTQIVIELGVTGSISGAGIAYFLQTMRVAQPSDAVNLPYVNELVPGARVWVDNNGADLWEVIEKQSPFTAQRSLEAANPIVNSLFGTSVAQGANNLIALVGSPGAGSNGTVYPYIRDVAGNYALTTLIECAATGTSGFGNAVALGNKNWGIVGASTSNTNAGYAVVVYRPSNSNAFEQTQMLVAPDQDFGQIEFGSSVTISEDERWIYVGAPGSSLHEPGGKAYAYGRVDIEEQSISYITDGETALFNYSNYITITNDQQLSVILNNETLQLDVDYSLNGVLVVLSTIPPSGLKLSISRKTNQAVGQWLNTAPNSTSGSGLGATFDVDVTDQSGGVYVVTVDQAGSGYAVSDTITILGSRIGGVTPTNDLTLTVTGVSGGAVTSVTASGTPSTTFSIYPYLYSADSAPAEYALDSFTVYVNSVIQRPHLDYDLVNDSGAPEIQFTYLLSTGDSVEIAGKTYFQHVKTLSPNSVVPGARFGTSVACSTDGRQVMIGAPNDTATELDAGSVYVFDRGVTSFNITDIDTQTYDIPTNSQSPVAILLNNQYLTNADQYRNGQITVDYVNDEFTFEDSVTLNVGDVVQIESNIFREVQKVVPNTPFQSANFGYDVDLCPNNCSLYIGAPNDSTVLEAAGSAERNVNQARTYGIITSTTTSPDLSASVGEKIIVQGQEIALSSVPSWNIALAYNSEDFVEYSANIYRALRTVPTGTDITDITYWGLSNWPTVMAQDIIDADIPNILATSANGLLTIYVSNVEAADEFNRLSLAPGFTGTLLDELGLKLFAWTQTITSPNPSINANFGYSISIDSQADNLVVGAPNANLYEPVTFDSGKTYFDDRSTVFSSTQEQSGAAYSFDLLSASNGTVDNPAQLVFGQQIYDNNVKSLDRWGTAVDYTGGKLLIGSPGSDLDDSTLSNWNYGRVGEFDNQENKLAWTVVHIEKPVGDVRLINSAYMFDFSRAEAQETRFFDFINPLQGKILGAAQQNINYTGAVDPARYNVGSVNNNGNYWAQTKVGEIWWDTNNTRFIDPNQDDLTYASRRWGTLFPGSTVDVYQWTESNVPPAQYTGPGAPYSTNSYTVLTRLTTTGVFETLYYFWVTNLDIINTTSGKTLSTNGIKNYIENPRSSGIPFVAILDASTVAVYNGLEFLYADDTILHIEYDREYTDDNIHTEYELVAQDKVGSFISDNLYRKLLDSFCGTNTVGAAVPDPLLSPPEKYGVQFRPRQSMFADRFTALENYLGRANKIIKQYPIVETKRFNLLNSSEPEPTSASGEWNKRVATIQELEYQDLFEVPLGYKYLVVTDSTQNGLWTIYSVIPGALPGSRTTQLARVQTYDTKKYWYHIDWYSPGYNSSIIPVAEVAVYSELATLTVSTGSSVKVTANSQGKFEIYLRTETGWDRVGLEDGTIQFREELWNYAVGNFGFDVEVFDAQYFDQEPTTETRKIIEAINQELFTGTLEIERNRLLVLMFEYILSEFGNPEWLTKTSLIDVVHNIRELVPYQIYRQDNQEFVLDYIQEVKPYHVQIREFNLKYNGADDYAGMMTDFDLPAYYNTNLLLPQYVSPVLLPYTQSSAVGTGTPSLNSDTPANAQLWLETPWNEWFNNYLLSLENATVITAGSGYTEDSEVIIGNEWSANTSYAVGEQIFYLSNLYNVTVAGVTSNTPPNFTNGSAVNGTATLTYVGSAAKGTLILGAGGVVLGLTITEPGFGYTKTPAITFGTPGSGAKVYAVMGNDLVRSFKTTIRYDRFQYTSEIVDWQAGTDYDNGTLVRYLSEVWEASSPDSSAVQGETFDPDFWTKINPATYQYPGSPQATGLTGVDRTQGLYDPTVNQPGLQLPLLIDGLDYPGVQVFGPLFNQNTGYDVGNFDINPFDNISFGPEGKPTYDPAILDAIYQSDYLDPYLGTLPAPAYDGAPPNQADAVVVDGGGYVDTYSSHAPEELVPGAEFDTLDLRVYTRPGSDWSNNGHGFAERFSKGVYVNSTTPFPFVGYIPYPYAVQVTNQTTGLELAINEDFVVDWVNQSVLVTNGATAGDVLVGIIFGLGGGNQLYREIIIGDDIVDNTVPIPVQFNELFEIVIFVNGVQTTDFTFVEDGRNTKIEFDNTYTSSDYIVLTAVGPTELDDGSTEVDYSWSIPITQNIIVGGPSLTFDLDNSLEYTNPVNMIVTVNGVRARTAAGAEYIADGSSAYLLPGRLGFSQALIADNQVFVYVDNVPQTLSVDYVVEPFDSEGDREVQFLNLPAIGSKILIAVTTNTQCYINSGQLVFNPTSGLVPIPGDIIAVTTWNDTRQQDLLTQVIVGPVTTGITINQPYDSTDFDSPSVLDPLETLPGLFDYTVGDVVNINDIQLGRIVTDPDRLFVYLNGRRIFFGEGFTINGEELVLASGTLNANDMVMITQTTESVVPNAMAFRIFQDMRGVQATYRITDNTTTQLTQELLAVDDVIHVEDASKLSDPNPAINIWGVITINGERIMYRERNTTANTVSSLLRGTAGTAATDHSVNSLVYDMGRGNIMPEQFQNYIESNSILANGTQTVFEAVDVSVDYDDSSLADQAVEVYVGGTRVTSGFTITAVNPVMIEFTTAPQDGVEVTILVRKGVTWYAPGNGTASNGVALQDTNTQAARFLRGL
jgi:hypothetical protein